MVQTTFQDTTNRILNEVKKIFEENQHCQKIHISIDLAYDSVPTIDFEVESRFPQLRDGDNK